MRALQQPDRPFFHVPKPHSRPAHLARGHCTLADFEILANEVYCGLPKEFRTLCADLVIRIEDFPTDEILDEMELDNPFDLLGLFQGVGLPFRAESAPVHMPDLSGSTVGRSSTTGATMKRRWAPSSPMC